MQESTVELSDVVKSLEQQVIQLAEKGVNMSNASKLLDTVSATIKSGKQGSFNKELNEIRRQIALVPIQLEYSLGIRPVLLAIYEVIIVAVIIGLCMKFHTNIDQLFSVESWSLPVVWFIGLVSGCIGAVLIALGGLYRHRISLTLNPSFELWYFLKPFVGAITGGFIALLANILITGINGSDNGQKIMIIISAFIAGMNERVAMEFLQKFTDNFMLQNKETDKNTNNSDAKGSGSDNTLAV